MENILITIVCIGLILIGTGSIASSAVTAADTVSSSWKQTIARDRDTFNTRITAISSSTQVGGGSVDVNVKNEGNISLRNYSKWDVVVRYQNGIAKWLPYTSATPGWIVDRILFNGKTEVFEPRIFNPGETMVIKARLSPAVSDNTTNLLKITTDAGAVAQITFGR